MKSLPVSPHIESWLAIDGEPYCVIGGYAINSKARGKYQEALDLYLSRKREEAVSLALK